MREPNGVYRLSGSVYAVLTASQLSSKCGLFRGLCSLRGRRRPWLPNRTGIYDEFTLPLDYVRDVGVAEDDDVGARMCQQAIAPRLGVLWVYVASQGLGRAAVVDCDVKPLEFEPQLLGLRAEPPHAPS